LPKSRVREKKVNELNFKKMGIRVILVTILLSVAMNYLEVDPYVRTALSVFGIGSGVALLFMESINHFR